MSSIRVIALAVTLGSLGFGQGPAAPAATPQAASPGFQALVQEACTALTTQHPARTLEWRVGTDLPQVLADEALLRQALAHLLGNAVKFTAPRERAIIGISAVVGDPATGVIEIRDNGVGFNPGAHAKLFQVFGRLHGAREFEGIGMGLAITRKIVQRLGGQVQAQGMLDEGCRLLLELPISARS